MFLLRNAQAKDLPDLLKLAQLQPTVNLPPIKSKLKKIIAISEKSFAGKISNKAKAQYVFVAEDLENGRVVGTAKIFAQHGTEKKPHLYFQVMKEKGRSKTLKVAFERKVLRLRKMTDGPTEIGGLVVHPDYRARPEALGMQLSYVRLVYMAIYPGRFKQWVIAELLPPLYGGRSLLWEAYGGRLTQLPYEKADLLSFTNKEFILSLFPQADLYVDLLPAQVQKDLEKTGPGAEKARRLLAKIGFQYHQQICPFDGGPHYWAKRRNISLCRHTHQLTLGSVDASGKTSRGFVCHDDGKDFRAVVGAIHMKKQLAALDDQVRALLGAGNEFYFCPMP